MKKAKVQWIITGRLEGGGTKFAFSVYNDKGKDIFALVPFSESGESVKGALAWPSEAEALGVLQSYRDHPEAWKALERLNPKVEPMLLAQDALLHRKAKGPMQ